MKTRIQEIRERVDGETMRPEHRKDISDLLAVVEVLMRQTEINVKLMDCEDDKKALAKAHEIMNKDGV